MNNTQIKAALLPVNGQLLLPSVSLSFSGLNPETALMLKKQDFVAVPLNTNSEKENWGLKDFHAYGVLCRPVKIHMEKNSCSLEVETLERVRLVDVEDDSIQTRCTYEPANEIDDVDETGKKQILAYMKQTIREMSTHFHGTRPIIAQMETIEGINGLICFLAQYMQLSPAEKASLLGMDSLKERALSFMDMLLTQKEQISLNVEMNEKISRQNSEWYRKQALRKQLEAIQEELDEEGTDEEEASFTKRIEESDMPETVKTALKKEAAKLERMSQPAGMEQDILRGYLEFALELPWKKEEFTGCDLEKARRILDQRHYGMDKVKTRIIQHLAWMTMKKEARGSALLLVGPPGTGKTSLARSIASAMDRPYTRLSLGGIRDESEIRGHRRTYVGAMAGRILQTMNQAGSTAPVMVLDEIDKMMQGGFSGDPMAAMLEVLDPEQNDTFTDHYLDQPYDLSNVFFIATANSLDSIPAPLLDRMEIIEVSGYTASEKFHIARDHLLPEVIAASGLKPENITVSDETLVSLIENYTMEAGCRSLKKRLEEICRYECVKLLTSENNDHIQVDAAQLEEIFGPVRARHLKVKDENPYGVVTGLAWTPVGGEVLYIETMAMPGNGATIITGQLGDVMKESVRIALSLIRSRLPLEAALLKDQDLHIHVPAGATPKDGPSAGITLFTALASLALRMPVDSHLAMTGEITLSGLVEPIGGLREKLSGALRAGIKKVLIPKANVADLNEVADEVKDQLEIIPVSTADEVLYHALGVSLPLMDGAQSALSGRNMA